MKNEEGGLRKGKEAPLRIHTKGADNEYLHSDNLRKGLLTCLIVSQSS